MDVLIGLDIGTTGVKAVAFTPDRTERAKAIVPTPTHRIDDRAEYDANELWQACATVLGRVADQLERSGLHGSRYLLHVHGRIGCTHRRTRAAHPPRDRLVRRKDSRTGHLVGRQPRRTTHHRDHRPASAREVRDAETVVDPPACPRCLGCHPPLAQHRRLGSPSPVWRHRDRPLLGVYGRWCSTLLPDDGQTSCST